MEVSKGRKITKTKGPVNFHTFHTLKGIEMNEENAGRRSRVARCYVDRSSPGQRNGTRYCVGTLLHKLIRHPPGTLSFNAPSVLEDSRRSRGSWRESLAAISMLQNGRMHRNDHRPCRTITASLIILSISFYCSLPIVMEICAGSKK